MSPTRDGDGLNAGSVNVSVEKKVIPGVKKTVKRSKKARIETLANRWPRQEKRENQS